MAYDPTKPANNSPLSAAEMRTQLAGLMDEIQQRALSVDVGDSIVAQSAGPVLDVDTLSMAVSNPPTQAQVQALANKLDELLTALKRL
jgi:hypothetical protein